MRMSSRYTKAKGKIFVKAKRGDDSCFWDIRRKNRYLVIGLHQI